MMNHNLGINNEQKLSDVTRSRINKNLDEQEKPKWTSISKENENTE